MTSYTEDTRHPCPTDQPPSIWNRKSAGSRCTPKTTRISGCTACWEGNIGEGQPIKSFFADSACYSLDREVLRPLSHIHANWELTWDHAQQRYLEEDDSYAKLLNELIDELASVTPPARYHDNEDRLAEYVLEHLKWPIRKDGSRWVGADYESIIEQGGFHDLDERNLVLAAAGRIQAAITRGQDHYDRMEQSHRRMLGAVLSVILYHRTDSN